MPDACTMTLPDARNLARRRCCAVLLHVSSDHLAAAAASTNPSAQCTLPGLLSLTSEDSPSLPGPPWLPVLAAKHCDGAPA